jgi:hypothetical protein
MKCHYNGFVFNNPQYPNLWKTTMSKGLRGYSKLEERLMSRQIEHTVALFIYIIV